MAHSCIAVLQCVTVTVVLLCAGRDTAVAQPTHNNQCTVVSCAVSWLQWCIGVLVQWCIGVLVYWCAVALV